MGAAVRWFADDMATHPLTLSAQPDAPAVPTRRAVDRDGLLIGVVVGIPAAVAAGAVMALSRSVFDTTNAALVLMIVVVAVAALGGRTAGIVTALTAAVSLDFFHTRPYLSLTIDSRDDVETTLLLLVTAVLVGTIASAGRSARRAGARPVPRSGGSTASPRRPCRRRTGADVIQVAQDELRGLLHLVASRFEARRSSTATAWPGSAATAPWRSRRRCASPDARTVGAASNCPTTVSSSRCSPR